MKLVEAYASRLNKADELYKRTHRGESLSEDKKYVIARSLENLKVLFKEGLGTGSVTQVGWGADNTDMKRTCTNIATVTIPNLIAHDLILVKAMSSIHAIVRYFKFVSAETKGNIKEGTLFNSPFSLGEMSADRMRYTSRDVVESLTTGTQTLKYNPTETTVKFVDKVSGAESTLTVTNGNEVTLVSDGDVYYSYDNVSVPQYGTPKLKAVMETIHLEAKVRRIETYFSQLSAIQLKLEEGEDLENLLSVQAVSELKYEQDAEVVRLLVDNAVEYTSLSFTKSSYTPGFKNQHYASFVTNIESLSQKIYEKTGKYHANILLCSADIIPIFAVSENWKASSKVGVGSYFAGTYNGRKVFVSAVVPTNTVVALFNGDDLMTSSAILGEFIPIAPTSLLVGADGTSQKGFATMYDLQLLNKALLAKIVVKE